MNLHKIVIGITAPISVNKIAPPMILYPCPNVKTG